MNTTEITMMSDGFNYSGKYYDCNHAIERDKRLILKEADESHKDAFDDLYYRESLTPYKIRLFLDEKDNPVFGIIIYMIDYREGYSKRTAMGNYYPLYETPERGKMSPHPYQSSICW